MIEEIVSCTLSAAGGGGVAGYVTKWLLEKQFAADAERLHKISLENQELAKRIETLEKEKIAALAADLRDHIKADRSQEILARLDSLIGQVSKLADNCQRSLERNADQEAHLVAHDKYLANLDKMVCDLVTPRHRRG